MALKLHHLFYYSIRKITGGKRPKIEVILHTKKQYNASFVPVFVCSSSLLLCNLVLTQNPFFYFYYIN